jgi:hypothetical protein
MPAGVTRIDHPVIAVRDMEQARLAYQRLGFIVPPQGSHLEWGTGNWCIMFADDYLELRGIIDASRYTHHLDVFLKERGEGLMGLAFGTKDADASYREALAGGLAPTAIKGLTRRFQLATGDVFPQFRIVYLSEADAPALLTCVICGHLTPDLIRRPEWLVHPNGVTGVLSITAVTSDPGAVRAAHERLLDPAVFSDIDGGFRAAPDEGAAIDVVSPAQAERRGLALAGAPLPYLPAMNLATSDLRAAREVLQANGVPFSDTGSSIRVEAAHACGVTVTLTAEGRK